MYASSASSLIYFTLYSLNRLYYTGRKKAIKRAANFFEAAEKPLNLELLQM